MKKDLEMIPMVRTCYVEPDQLLLDKNNSAIHIMAELPTLIVVLDLMKYRSAHFSQIHEYTSISKRLTCKDICKLK